MSHTQTEQMIGAMKIKDGLFIGDQLAAIVMNLYSNDTPTT